MHIFCGLLHFVNIPYYYFHPLSIIQAEISFVKEVTPPFSSFISRGDEASKFTGIQLFNDFSLLLVFPGVFVRDKKASLSDSPS